MLVWELSAGEKRERSDLHVEADMPDMPVSSGFGDSLHFSSLNQFDWCTEMSLTSPWGRRGLWSATSRIENGFISIILIFNDREKENKNSK